MSDKDVRKGVTNARFNEDASNWVMGEIVIVSIFSGVWSKSWWVFGGVFVGLLIIFTIPKLRIWVVGIFTVGYAALGYTIGQAFHSLAASIVLGVIGILICLGVHMAAIEWIDDID